jgi:hypothetical protein
MMLHPEALLTLRGMIGEDRVLPTTGQLDQMLISTIRDQYLHPTIEVVLMDTLIQRAHRVDLLTTIPQIPVLLAE